MVTGITVMTGIPRMIGLLGCLGNWGHGDDGSDLDD